MRASYIAAAVALMGAASATFAQDAAPIPLTLTPGAGGSLGVSFQREVSGLFVDTFSFVPSNVGGTVTVTLIPGSAQVGLFAALLNGEGFGYLPESGQSTFAFQSIATADTSLSLTVFGFSGDAESLTESTGSYTGNVTVQTVSAIPEPETYALMMIGLGAMGFVARCRKKV
jgi:hypothetical protein